MMNACIGSAWGERASERASCSRRFVLTNFVKVGVSWGGLLAKERPKSGAWCRPCGANLRTFCDDATRVGILIVADQARPARPGPVVEFRTVGSFFTDTRFRPVVDYGSRDGGALQTGRSRVSGHSAGSTSTARRGSTMLISRLSRRRTQTPPEATRASVAELCREHTGLIEPQLRAHVSAGSPALRDAATYFLDTGGKRFRPLLTLLACEAVGGTASVALDLACAVEFLHASSLIFDDLPCMDNADERRGAPTLHRRYGEAVAVLTAIYFLNKAYELALNSSGGDTWAAQAINRCIGEHGMVEGQLLDLAGRHGDRAVRGMKTGSLIRMCVEIGARAGRASDGESRALVRYAQRLGQAFQMRDDVLDGEADSACLRAASALAGRAAEIVRRALRPSLASSALSALAFYAVDRPG